MDKKPSIFEVLGAGRSFSFGVILAFLVIFSVGFFIMLFSDGGFSLSSGKSDRVFADFNNPADSGGDSGGQAAPTEPSTEIDIAAISSDDHIRGDIKTAEVVIVEFSDIDCPFCSRFHPTMQQVMDDYDGKVAWVYRHFPLDSLHPQARTKAEASECVDDLGGNVAFWSFIDQLYENDVDDLASFAEASGVNVVDFNECVNNKKFADKVQSQYEDAVSSGGRGTPYSVALTKDGQRVPISGALPLAQIKSILDPLVQ